MWRKNHAKLSEEELEYRNSLKPNPKVSENCENCDWKLNNVTKTERLFGLGSTYMEY